MEKTFSIRAAIKHGWQVVTEDLGLYIAMVAIPILVTVVFSIVQGILEKRVPVLPAMLGLAGTLMTLLFQLGQIKMVLKTEENLKPEVSDLFSGGPLYLNSLKATALFLLRLIAGFVLLVVPAVIWALRYQFYNYAMVDKNLSARDSMRESARITEGAKWKLLELTLVLIALNIAGALCLLVGLLVTMPVSMIAMGHVYRELQGQSDSAPRT